MIDANLLAVLVVAGIAILIGGLIKVVEWLRDWIFPIEVDVYLVRSGEMRKEKDYARKSKSPHKSYRFFLLKRWKSTTEVDYDCIEKFHKKDRITLVETSNGQYTPTKKTLMTLQKSITGDETEIVATNPEQLFAMLPRQSKEQEEALYDSADTIASPAFLPMKNKGFFDDPVKVAWMMTLITIFVVFFAGQMFAEKYFQAAKDYAVTVHYVNARAAGRDGALEMILEWNRTGKIPSFAFNNTMIDSAKPPDMVGKLLNAVIPN